MEKETAAFNNAGGFHYRVQMLLMTINMIRTNFDPKNWYFNLRSLSTEVTPELEIKENNPFSKSEDKYDRWWADEEKHIHNEVTEAMGDFNELTNDETADEHQANEIHIAKQKTFNPLDRYHRHLLKLIWKKGWAMPESRDIGL